MTMTCYIQHVLIFLPLRVSTWLLLSHTGRYYFTRYMYIKWFASVLAKSGFILLRKITLLFRKQWEMGEWLYNIIPRCLFRKLRKNCTIKKCQARQFAILIIFIVKMALFWLFILTDINPGTDLSQVKYNTHHFAFFLQIDHLCE